MALFGIVHLEDQNDGNILVYARPRGDLPIDPPHTFLMSKSSDMFAEMYECAGTWNYWDVPMDRFTTSKDNPLQHEELVTIDIESILKSALDAATKARFSEVNSMFADFVSEEQLLENVRGSLENVRIYKASVIILKNGYRQKQHEIYPLYASNDVDAYKVLKSVLHQREGHEVKDDDILKCDIYYKGRRI